MNELEQFLHDHMQIRLIDRYTTASANTLMQCMICDHTWLSRPGKRKSEFVSSNRRGCPNCTQIAQDAANAASRIANMKLIEESGTLVLTKDYDGRSVWTVDGKRSKIRVKNTSCGHEFDVLPQNLIANPGMCSTCGKDSRLDKLATLNEVRFNNKIANMSDPFLQYVTISNKMLDNLSDDQLRAVDPKRLSSKSTSHQIVRKVPLKDCYDRNVPVELTVSTDNLQLVDVSEDVVHNSHVPASLSSYFATETYNLLISRLHELFPQYVNNNTNQLFAPVLICEDRRIAVFLISINSINDNKLAEKIKLTWNSIGYRTVIVFEDELQYSEAIVISKISHIFGISTGRKVYARHCTLRFIAGAEKNHFVNMHHIQGADRSQFAVGAFYEDRLVAVMCFSTPGKLSKRRERVEGEWELSRFCTHTDYRVVGIGSKMVNFAINRSGTELGVDITSIISFADLRWSSPGGVYEKLGFVIDSTNPPQYYYVQDGKRKHRWGFRKDALREWLPSFDPNKTELQNLTDAGYHRVYDCGRVKYTLDVQHLVKLRHNHLSSRDNIHNDNLQLG